MHAVQSKAPNPLRIGLIALALIVVGVAIAIATVGLPRRPASIAAQAALDPWASEDTWRYQTGQAKRRGERIQAELRALGPRHPWAGEYRWSSGFEYVRLSIAPGSGVLMRPGADVVGMDPGFEAPVRVAEGGIVQLLWPPAQKASASGFLSDELIPVRWGERHYLLSPSALPGFVERIHLGFEPRVDLISPGQPDRRDTALLRVGDELRPVEGVPRLPSGPLPGLRLAPQGVGVLGVEVDRLARDEGVCRISYRFDLDQGRRDGLRVGEQLDMDSSVGHGRLRLVQVGPRRSVAVWDGDGCEPRRAALRRAAVNRTFYNPVAAQMALAAASIGPPRRAE